MIKIKLANGSKTKPLQVSQFNNQNNEESKTPTPTTNPVLKAVSKSIQSRVKDINAIDPKLLKIKKSIF